MSEPVDKRDQVIQELLESNNRLRGQVRDLEADVLKRAGAEQEARAAQEQMRLIADCSSDYILLTGLDGKIAFVNRAFPGFTAEQFLGKPVDSLPGIRQAAEITRCLARVRETGRQDRFEVGLTLANRKLAHFEGNVAPVVKEGELTAFAITMRDVSHYRRMTQALWSLVEGTSHKAGREFFQSLVRSLATALHIRHVMIAVQTADRGRMRTLAVWSDEGIVDDFEFAVDRTPNEEVLEHALGFHADGVCEMFPCDPLLADLQAQSYLGIRLLSNEGSLLGVLAGIDDRPLEVTADVRAIFRIFAQHAEAELERKAAADALRQSRHDLELAQSRARIGSWVLNPESRTGVWSRQMFELFSRDPAQGVPELDEFLEYVHPDDLPGLMEAHERALSGEAATRMDFRTNPRRGPERFMQANVNLVIDEQGGGKRLVGTTIDVTERRRAEDALRASESRLRTLVDSAPEAIVIIDADTGQFVDCNPNALYLFEMSRETLLSIDRPQVSTLHQPDGRLSTAASKVWLERTLAGETPAFEWTYRSRTRERIPCEVRLVRLPHPDQRLIRGSITDITARKAAEQEREDLIRKLEEKNAELERFTYTVSHDLKSPLVTIKGFVGMLAEDLRVENHDSVEEDLKEISRAADRMRGMLDELLHLSRIGRIANPSVRLSMRDVVGDAIDNLSHLIKERGAQVTICQELPDVFGDRVRLVEVVQNLVDNGIKFCRSDHPHIEVGARSEGDETVFLVRDNGAGIEPDYHERVFGLFERLELEQDGSGVGLAIVKRIIELHGGRIWVESQGQGDGATFCFTLPVSDERSDRDQV